jgi:hypothetical protein
MARPKSVEEQIVSSSFSYTPPASMAVGTVDVVLGPTGVISGGGTFAGDASIGRLRTNYNVNLWVTNLPGNNAGLVISNPMCIAAGQLNFRLSTNVALGTTPPATTLMLQQF